MIEFDNLEFEDTRHRKIMEIDDFRERLWKKMTCETAIKCITSSRIISDKVYHKSSVSMMIELDDLYLKWDHELDDPSWNRRLVIHFIWDDMRRCDTWKQTICDTLYREMIYLYDLYSESDDRIGRSVFRVRQQNLTIHIQSEMIELDDLYSEWDNRIGPSVFRLRWYN